MLARRVKAFIKSHASEVASPATADAPSSRRAVQVSITPFVLSTGGHARCGPLPGEPAWAGDVPGVFIPDYDIDGIPRRVEMPYVGAVEPGSFAPGTTPC